LAGRGENGGLSRFSARAQLRFAVSAARHHDNARRAVQYRVPLRRDLSRRAVSRWSGPARSRQRAPGKGCPSDAGQMGIHGGHRIRLLLEPAQLSDGGGLFQSGGRSAGRALVAALPCCDDTRQGRPTERIAAALGADARVGGRRARARSGGPQAAAARRARSDRAAAASRRCSCRAHGNRADDVAAAHQGRRAAGNPRGPAGSALRIVCIGPGQVVAAISALSIAGRTYSLRTPIVTPEILAPLAIGVLGLAVGSFLNVCIYRIPRNLSIVSPRSRCTACGHDLSWYENLPVVSYAWLRGKCRSCGAPFSMMYPLVELTTAAVFVGGYWRYGASPMLAARLLFACAMIALFVIDLQHKILPNEITLPGVVVGLV